MREKIAFLLWCYQHGYVSAQDRLGMNNWMLGDPAKMHPDDVIERANLLELADEILKEIN